MSSTATPMWSMRPNTGRSLCGRRRIGGVGVFAAFLGSEDLPQRRDRDLELLGRRLLRRPVALDLTAGGVEGLGQLLAMVAIAPGEHLHRDRGAAEGDAAAGRVARLLAQPLQRNRAAGGEQ